MPEQPAGRILLVDDTEANRYALGRMLKRAGFQIQEAADGETALRLARDLPDLVVLDVRLPDLSGYEVCRQLKADARTAPILVLQMSASFVRPEDRAHGLEVGADGYLTQPVDERLLIATVNGLLRARRAERALRESEQRYRALAESIPQLAWSCDAQGRVLDCNQRWLDYTGQSPSEAEGATWLAAVHPDDRERAEAKWHECVASGEGCEGEYRIRRAVDGQDRWHLFLGVPTRDEDGHIARWFGTCTDVHDQHLARDERLRLLDSEQAARAEAERANRLKDEFLATVSHELRTPLNAIMGWVHLLKKSPSNAEVFTRGLEVIDRSTRSQSQLISDLLDISRILSGKLRVDMQSVQLPAVVEAAIDSARPLAETKGIRIETDVQTPDGRVLGDAERLQQVIWNLLTNAIKFTPEGGRVRVCLRFASSSAEIVISDTGCGIEEQFLPHLFERFRQADASPTRKHGGLGIGLSLVRQLVELHGGAVSAASEGPGKGATFTVQLPLSVEQQISPAPDPADGDPQEPSDRPDTVSLRGIRLLVVEDDSDSREMMRRILGEHDAHVVTAASAAEALHLLAAEDVHVLLSDIGMPDRDGYSLIREVRAQGSRIPAVAFTAFARPDDRVQALNAGYDRYAAKPVDPNKLVRIIAGLASRAAEAPREA